MNENKDYIIQLVDLEEGKVPYISYIAKEKNFETTLNINEAKRMTFEQAIWYCNNTLKQYDTRLHKIMITITETIIDTKEQK